MVAVNITSGAEVEGRRIDEELTDELFGPNATDTAKVSGLNRFLQQQLAIVIAIDKGWTFANAEAFVSDHITVIT